MKAYSNGPSPKGDRIAPYAEGNISAAKRLRQAQSSARTSLALGLVCLVVGFVLSLAAIAHAILNPSLSWASATLWLIVGVLVWAAAWYRGTAYLDRRLPRRRRGDKRHGATR